MGGSLPVLNGNCETICTRETGDKVEPDQVVHMEGCLHRRRPGRLLIT